MLIRIVEIGADGGFTEIESFRDHLGLCNTHYGRDRIRDIVENRPYFDPEKAYLVLHPICSFTMNYMQEAVPPYD